MLHTIVMENRKIGAHNFSRNPDRFPTDTCQGSGCVSTLDMPVDETPIKNPFCLIPVGDSNSEKDISKATGPWMDPS